MGQHAVNIAYPIDGETYTNYFTSSFSTTCQGGQHDVEWGFDGNAVGKATFYAHFNAQFTHKLPSGKHTFYVKGSCGGNEVVFSIT